jgi:N4-gp56 family major capsid protein
MSSNTQTLTAGSSGLTNEDKQFYDNVLLERSQENLIHTQFGQLRPIPGGIGTSIEFRRFERITTTEDTTLTDGTVPSGESLSISTVVASVPQYGAYVLGSDHLELASVDPVLSELTGLLGQHAGETLDRVARNILTAGTTVQYANARASRTALNSGDVLDSTEVLTAVANLKNQNARPLVSRRFVALIHPFTWQRLMADTTITNIFQNAYQRSDEGNPLAVGELGDIYGVRFVESSNSRVFSSLGQSGSDVYATLVLGADAYGVSEIDSLSLQSYFQPRGSGGATGDPLHQIWSMGWKASFTAVILNQNWIRRVEHWSN